MSEPIVRVIKRYSNRKLYDTRDSKYVTLVQIAEMIRDGVEVKIIDNSTKEDLTSVTFAQIIFEEEKKKGSFLPLSLLRKMIQSGGESINDIVHQISESAERVGRVFRREDEEGEEVREEAVLSEPVVAETDDATASSGNTHSKLDQVKGDVTATLTESTKAIREFIDNIQSNVDDWQKKLDGSIHQTLESLSPFSPLQKDVNDLQKRINELESKLAAAQKDSTDKAKDTSA